MEDFNIKTLEVQDQPLWYGCQTSRQMYVKTSSIANLEKSSYYYRIHYPMTSFKSFFNLNVDFDPFVEDIYYYIEYEAGLYNSGGGDAIRVFKVTLPEKDGKKDGTFHVDDDIDYIDGICITGPGKYTIINQLKTLCSKIQQANYIEECRNGEQTASRYLPNPEDMIEQINDEKLITKLIECYKLLLDDIDGYGVINYNELIDQSLANIEKRIIKPIITNMICACNTIFNKLIDVNYNIESDCEEIMRRFAIKTRDLTLLDCVPGFNKLVNIMIDQDALTDLQNNKELHSIVPAHYLCIWELIKLLKDVFATTYIDLKKCESYVQSRQQTSNIYSTANSSDEPIDNFKIFDNDFTGNGTLTIGTKIEDQPESKFPECEPDFFGNYDEKIKLFSQEHNFNTNILTLVN